MEDDLSEDLTVLHSAPCLVWFDFYQPAWERQEVILQHVLTGIFPTTNLPFFLSHSSVLRESSVPSSLIPGVSLRRWKHTSGGSLPSQVTRVETGHMVRWYQAGAKVIELCALSKRAIWHWNPFLNKCSYVIYHLNAHFSLYVFLLMTNITCCLYVF